MPARRTDDHRPAPPPPRSAPAAEGPDWGRVISALRRYKWLVLAVSLLGLAGGVVASRLLKPQYVAQATIWIDQDGRNGAAAADRGPLRPAQSFDAEAWVDLLRSFTVLDSVARELHLFLAFTTPAPPALADGFTLADQFRPGAYRLTLDPSGVGYVLSTADGVPLERGAVGDSIGRRLGFRWAPPAAALRTATSVAFTVTAPRDAARSLGDALHVEIDQEGNFLKMELTGPYPARLAAVLNAVAGRYVAVAAELKRQKLIELTKILADQASYASANLNRAEQAYEGFRERTITLPSEQAASPSAAGGGSTGPGGAAPPRDPLADRFFEAQADQDQLAQDRRALAALLAGASDSAFPVEALAAIPAVKRSSELTGALGEHTAKVAELHTLEERYTDAYPPLVRLRSELQVLDQVTIPKLARALATRLASLETGTGRQVAAMRSQLVAMPARTLTDERLQRAVALAENTYNTVQQRYEEAQIAEASAVPTVRVLDPAVVPQRPVKNTAPRIIALGLLAGLALSLGGAVVLDRFDPRFRYPHQVSHEMGLTILGTIPHLAHGRSAGELRLEDAAAFIEALRGVRMSLASEHGDGRPLVVTITSPGSADGKSFLSSNLARVFAEGGRRTLLIDGDLRRGLLHRRLAVARRPGLAELLRGDASRESVIRRTGFRGLDLIPCGMRVSDAPELLGAPATARLLEELAGAYDVILCDSPPLTAGVDPYLLATVTRNVALVVRTGVSLRDLTGAKLEVLERMPVRVLGVILNDVPEGGVYGYYSYYLPGYEAADEERHRLEAPPVVL